MSRALRIFMLSFLLVWTWAIVVFHEGEFLPPTHQAVSTKSSNSKQLWIPKEKYGIHQMVLSGSPFERGVASGQFTEKLLFLQEKSLVDKLRTFFPSEWILKPLQVLMVRYFWGADRYFEPWTREEMDGVSRSAPHAYDDLGSPYVRQLYYHGLHEVGQMMVDQTGDDMGCTVAAYPFQNGWVVGRNFDFEGGRIFDEEKIMKWVFPNQGYAYVSVIWAGMVGAVTGVNENGIYISINAAGTKDFRRYGTPTTLVLLKALQFAKSGEEAVKIIEDAETFITDIFVVSDRQSGKLYRIEKAPHHFETTLLQGPSIVTNHLVSDYWKNDAINRFRRDELTSIPRYERGKKLIADMKARNPKTAREIENGVLSILRDKGEANGKPLHLGNRGAIDAMIATHAVIFDAPENRLYVTQGPSLAGAFTGFDLTESFKRHEPVVVDGLPRDPLLSDQKYADIKLSYQVLSDAEKLLRKKKCDRAEPLLARAKTLFDESYNYSMAAGDYRECVGDHAGAIKFWKEALDRNPAYASERRYLLGKLK